jgi:hypothetical protein
MLRRADWCSHDRLMVIVICIVAAVFHVCATKHPVATAIVAAVIADEITKHKDPE